MDSGQTLTLRDFFSYGEQLVASASQAGLRMGWLAHSSWLNLTVLSGEITGRFIFPEAPKSHAIVPRGVPLKLVSD